METEGSLSNLQEPETGLYLEPFESSPCPRYPISLLSHYLLLGSPSDLFPCGFSHQNAVRIPLLSVDSMYLAHLILPDLNILIIQSGARNDPVFDLVLII
jgi:hypothetical protein